MLTIVESAQTLGQLVLAYVDEQIRVIVDNDEPLRGEDQTVVHPTRVAIRRLRATLRTFRRVFGDEAPHLAAELRWFGQLLGDVRDMEVLEERFGLAAGSKDGVTDAARGDSPDAAGSPDSAMAATAALREAIDARRTAAWAGVHAAMHSRRYTELRTRLVEWQRHPSFSDRADRPAEAARKRVDAADRTLRKRLRRASEHARAGAPDAAERWHSARKAGKRHRYAVELAAPTLGADADEIIERRRELQDALGERQDAIVALQLLADVTDTAGAEAVDGIAALIADERARLDGSADEVATWVAPLIDGSAR